MSETIENIGSLEEVQSEGNMISPFKKNCNLITGIETNADYHLRCIGMFKNTLSHLLRSRLKIVSYEERTTPGSINQNIIYLFTDPFAKAGNFKISVPYDSLAVRMEILFYDIILLIPENGHANLHSLKVKIANIEKQRIEAGREFYYNLGLSFLLCGLVQDWMSLYSEYERLFRGQRLRWERYRIGKNEHLEKLVNTVAARCVSIITYLGELRNRGIFQ